MSTPRDPRHAPRVALLAIFVTCALTSSNAFAQSSCDEAPACYEDGLAAFIGGDYGRALLLWQLGYKLDPKDGLFPYSMVTAYGRTKQFEKAIDLSRNVESDHANLGDKRLTKNLARRLSYSSALAAQEVARDLRSAPNDNKVTPPPVVAPAGYAFPSGRGVVGIGLTVVGAGLLGGMALMNTQYGFEKSCVESPNDPENLAACPRPEIDYDTFCNTPGAMMSTDSRITDICDGQGQNIGTAITRDQAETSRFIGLGLLLSGIVVSGAGLTLVIVDLLGASPPTPQATSELTPIFMVQPDGAYTGLQLRF